MGQAVQKDTTHTKGEDWGVVVKHLRQALDKSQALERVDDFAFTLAIYRTRDLVRAFDNALVVACDLALVPDDVRILARDLTHVIVKALDSALGSGRISERDSTLNRVLALGLLRIVTVEHHLNISYAHTLAVLSGENPPLATFSRVDVRNIQHTQ